MRLVIFGANGGTGRRATIQALAADHQVAAVTRHPEDFPISHPNLDVVQADVYDKEQVYKAVDAADAVVSALGVPFSREPITIYSVGIANIIEAMHRHHVHRIVAVSSSALDPRPHADGGFMINRIMQPLITRTIGKSTYADMAAMERSLANSNLDWTVLRPSGLFDVDDVSDYRLAENHADGIFTSRADLAACLITQTSDQRWHRKRVAVTTSQGAPTVWQMIRREAFGGD